MLTNVLIAENDANERQLMREVTSSCEGCVVTGVARECQEAVEMTLQLRPDIVLVAYKMGSMSGLGICETIVDMAPEVVTVVVVEERTPEVVEEAMRSGARAVLARPLDPSELESLISGLAETRDRRLSSDMAELKDLNSFPRIITVTGAKGGVGKSTVACNLAVALAKRFPGKVALLDMNTQFGDVATMLNVRPRRTLSELDGAYKDMDAQLLASYTSSHTSGLDIICASDDPLALGTITPECVESVLYLLKSRYRFTVVDLPHMLQDISLHVLAQSHHVLLVSNLHDVTAAYDTKQLYNLLTGARMPRENIKIVLNRVEKTNPLTCDQITQMLRITSCHTLPDDPGLVVSANEGRPFVSVRPQSPFSCSVSKLAEDICGEAFGSEPATATDDRGKGFWSFLRGSEVDATVRERESVTA